MAQPIIYTKDELKQESFTPEVIKKFGIKPVPHEDTAFEDGEEVKLCCSNCDKPLVVIWRTRPNEKLKNKLIQWKLKAKCCYCGDASFAKTVKGGFHYKGFDVPHPNGNPEDVIAHVNVTTIDTEGEDVIFNTEKKI